MGAVIHSPVNRGVSQLERCLVQHGAATLAGLKTATLFCLSQEPGWQGQVAWWDCFLKKKGLRLAVMRCRGQRVLLYLWRPSQLRRDLQQPGVGEFLAQYGYGNTQVEPALLRLRSRLEKSPGFPHEIGLFLGYPLGDVAGFIENQGKNCKCVGCWKVYCNELEARQRFSKIQKCHRVYNKLWVQGRSVWQLAVAA